MYVCVYVGVQIAIATPHACMPCNAIISQLGLLVTLETRVHTLIPLTNP